MNDMIKTGEIDTKHFLIAIIAIVAIVALAFSVFFVSEGFSGTSYKVFSKNNEDLVVIDWACFEECNDVGGSVTSCKNSCELNLLVLQE